MHTGTHVRAAEATDERDVADLAIVNDMFAVDEMDDFTEMFRGAVNGDLPGHQWLVASTPEDGVVASAYVAPEPFADRLWNLYFLAVHPVGHGRGTGTALMAHVEDMLREAGESQARILIVETSSTDQYAATRAFYLARGFDEEARIRDFYGPGDDKVVFWKNLTL
ncbi:MAG TPA: GNAT family N-acetyltransferase [Nocardioides sp.]|nr:GNAT family N-acetyltransferase [Nocardioides sp.]